jgi:hypothetical protein
MHKNKMVVRPNGTATIRTRTQTLNTGKLYPGYSVRVDGRRLCRGAVLKKDPPDEETLIFSSPKQLALDCNAILFLSEHDF